MYDRLIPSEVYRSENFLDLPSDTHRLLFLALLGRADDFGNIDGNPRRLVRWAWEFTQLKSLEGLGAALSALEGAGLVRQYVVDGKPYLNLPRFRNARRYFRRHCPPSPWCDPAAKTGPYVAGIQLSRRVDCRAGGRLAESTRQISGAATKSESELTIQVGVEEEKRNGGPQLPTGSRLPRGWTLPAEWLRWALQFWEEQRRPLTEGEVLTMAQHFHAYWGGRSGRDGRRLDWLATWRVFVRQAGAGNRSLYSGGNGAAPAHQASRTGSDRSHQAS